MSEFYKTLIIGQSGAGKTYGARTLNPETTAFINVENKPLPFKNKFTKHYRLPKYQDVYKQLIECGKDSSVEVIVLDSLSAYFDALVLECRATKKGFDVWNMYNDEIDKLLDIIKRIPKEMIITGHYEILNIEGNTEKRVKVKGKEREGMIEKDFTIVMYADKKFDSDKNKFEYYLELAGEGLSAKCPPDIFGEDVYKIQNDYKFIIDTINEFKK